MNWGMGRKRNGSDMDVEDQVPEGDALAEETGSGAESAPAEGEDWKSKYLYSLAEMDNVRRRARLDAEDARKFANERLVSDLLPVLDNFNRALEAADQGGTLESLRSGVELIHRQLNDILTRAGLERIEAVGQPFDPNLHQAVMQVEPEEGQDAHLVVQELQAGYRLNDRVVRPTLVKVTSG
jgi:molecular chaperone GrpE